MGMVVRTNTMSTNAYRQLGMNNTQLAKSLEKLSSGYRINRAGDDASGLAISEKMKAQIKGLEQASSNSQDGISLVQTAEGALTEVHSMLNRMVELATKSANGTIQDDVDRDAIQTEVDALNTEISRIAKSSNFNGINLLDGSLGSLSDGVEVTVGSNVITKLTDNVKSVKISYSAGSGTDTPATMSAAIDDDGVMTLTVTGATGSGTAQSESMMEAALVAAGQKDADVTTFAAISASVSTAVNTTAIQKTAASLAAATTQDGFSITFAKGETGLASITVTDATDTQTTSNVDGAVSIVLDTAKSYSASDVNKMLSDAGVEGVTVAFEGSKIGSAIETGLGIENTTKGAITEGTGSMAAGLTIQVGTTNDSFNQVTVKIDDLTAAGLGIDGLDVSTLEAAGNAITTIEAAINKVSTNRGNLGALQNRLEYATNSLDTTAENMDAANSRIRDTDMAKEMMNYTKMNILSQAAQAMLAQANQQPQNILQLLQ